MHGQLLTSNCKAAVKENITRWIGDQRECLAKGVKR